MVRGKTSQLTYGKKTPWLTMQTEPTLGTLEFAITHEDDGIVQTSDEEFREVKQACLRMLETVPNIPAPQESVSPLYERFQGPLSIERTTAKMIKYRGYYEAFFGRFAPPATKPNLVMPLSPIFLDHQKKSFYQLSTSR